MDDPSFGMLRTAPGEQRTIALDGGSRIEMNGGTELALAGGDIRQVKLLAGEAVFYVVDGVRSPFRVEVGDLTLIDRGTVFNVVRDRGSIRVGVAEGQIFVNSSRGVMTLVIDQMLRLREEAGNIDLARATPESIIGWRTHRLVYRNGRPP